MDQQPKSSNKKRTSYDKPTVFTVLFILVLLSYFIVQKLFYNHNTNYTSNALSLPKPLPQHTSSKSSTSKNEWTVIKPHSGDSLASVFKRVGLSRQILPTILKNNPHAKLLASIKPDQEIKFLIHNETLEKLILPLSITQDVWVTYHQNKYTTKIITRETTQHNDFVTATVYGSLYGSAKRNNISSRLIQQMTDIFYWEIDFAREVRAGDQFSIVYQANYIQDKLVSIGDIIAVTYTSHDNTHYAIRHVNASGDSDYFNRQGLSLKKAFTRYPVKFSHISSTFSLSRYHPVLHYRRPHKGIDLAASIGTPIYATGDGRITVIDRHNGYGNMIKISHNNTYSSLYAHMLRFQKGLSKGSYVKRGQVIGYVGQTGLADGPHCHYEFHVNHQPRNPSTIELPHGSPIPTKEKLAFQTKANTVIAQLKLYETAQLATNNRKTSNTG